MLCDGNAVLLHLCDYSEAGLRDLGQPFLLCIALYHYMRINRQGRKKMNKFLLFPPSRLQRLEMTEECLQSNFLAVPQPQQGFCS